MELVATISSKPNRTDFVKEILRMPGGEKILDCIQCGVCAGSCPTRFAMDYSPMQILKMILLGEKHAVLSSSTIWICSTCFSCATRCPRSVNITEIMATLKTMAIKEKIVDKYGEKGKFNRAFFEVITKLGRLHEPALMIKLLKKTDPKGLIHNARLGWRLLKKGKLRVRAKKIQQLSDLRTILENIPEETE